MKVFNSFWTKTLFHRRTSLRLLRDEALTRENRTAVNDTKSSAKHSESALHFQPIFCTGSRCSGQNAQVMCHLQLSVGQTCTWTRQECQHWCPQLRHGRLLQTLAMLLMRPWYLTDLRRLHRDWSVSVRWKRYTLRMIAWRRCSENPLQNRLVRGLVCSLFTFLWIFQA